MAIASISRPRVRRLWTFDEMVAKLPETNMPTELWDGEIIMSPAPRPSHQEIVLNFASVLKHFVTAKKLGKVFVSPIDVVLSQRRVVQPDIIFIAKARFEIVQDCIRGVPDLAVEVISEGSWRRDRVDKKGLYEQFGLPEYWIVDPESQTIEVFVLDKGAHRLHARAGLGQTAVSRILPGFNLNWEQLVA
ncbi:MAG: Uma2 family endonuclease [Verrucomicrobiota bacterium]